MAPGLTKEGQLTALYRTGKTKIRYRPRLLDGPIDSVHSLSSDRKGGWMIRVRFRRAVYLTHCLFDPDTITIKFTICGTARVTETSIRILVPVFCTRDIRFSSVGPENRPNGFLASAGSETLYLEKKDKHKLGYVSWKRSVLVSKVAA